MNKTIITVLIGAALTVSLAGCGTSQNTTNSQSKNATQSSSTSKSSQDSSMKGMKMDNQQPLAKAFQDELNGFTTIEKDVQKGDYKSAQTLATNLHDEFHAAILPPLKAKKGAAYAENIHGKYDELQNAITSKNHAKIAQSLKVNRDNLHTIAPIVGVSLK